jgi:hypothetical protein
LLFIWPIVSNVTGGTITSLKGDITSRVETSSYIRLQLPNAQMQASILQSNGFDVLRDTVTITSLDLIVSPGELELLMQRGYKPIILSQGRPFLDIIAERTAAGFNSVPPGYLTLSQIINEMNSAESSYPSICQVFDLTTTYNLDPTYEGRHLYALKISDNVSEDEDEPTFLMVSCHHAREIVTPVIALYAIDQITSNYGSNPDITSLVDDYEIWICPVWNPDGYEYVFNVNNMWRKNRCYFPGYGTYGVDLNRNYPFGWYSVCSGSTNPSSETYKGPSPASEAETQAMIVFTNDQHFAKVIDYHSSGREVLYGYCCHSHPFTSFFQSEAGDISTAAGYFGSIRPPSAEGEHYEWQIWTNGSYANLMETHTTFQPSYSSALAEATMVWPSTLHILQRPISLSGNVKDSITGEPIAATITLDGITFPNSEEFISEPDFGRYHLFLPSGTYSVEFSAPGYHSQTHQVTVIDDSAEVLEVLLVRFNDPPYTPLITGSGDGYVGCPYAFTVVVVDPEGDDVFYMLDWGDGTYSEWLGPYPSGVEITVFHVYDTPGQYEIRVKAKDIYGAETPWSDPLLITIYPNMFPDTPEINGPKTGRPGTEYNYTFRSTDAEAHLLYYYIEWDDGNIEEWIGPYEPGEPVTVNHTWDEKGTYNIRAKARDECDAEGGWGTLKVFMPRNKVLHNSLFLRFLEQFPNAFPILRYIFRL